MDLRCAKKKHGVVIDDHTIEIACDSYFCGKRPGIIVLHRFDLRTGEATTNKYREIRSK